MIPVPLAPEPDDFNTLVRQPGLQWLRKNSLPADQPPPAAAQLPPYWHKTTRALWESYSGICAYLCLYMEEPLGAHSTDHFIAKSRNSGAAYDWTNYRLSCLGANRNKNRFDDILDPMEIEADTFRLDLCSGRIYPSPAKDKAIQERATMTIQRLRLADEDLNRTRADWFTAYVEREIGENHLRKRSPFVWQEARRQGVLRA